MVVFCFVSCAQSQRISNEALENLLSENKQCFENAAEILYEHYNCIVTRKNGEIVAYDNSQNQIEFTAEERDRLDKCLTVMEQIKVEQHLDTTDVCILSDTREFINMYFVGFYFVETSENTETFLAYSDKETFENKLSDNWYICEHMMV